MSITWNGVSSDTIGVIVERIPNRYVPTRRFSPQQVAGRNGNILLVDKSFPNVEQEYEVYLSAEAQGLPSVARACAEWLMGPDGYCRLEDSYDTTVYREAFLMGGYDLENILNKFGRCTITFSCKPQKYLLTGDTPIEIPAGVTTYTGDVVQFDGVTGASITSLSTTITPTQDLHGYATPWPGGGGVNAIDPSQFPVTISGVTYVSIPISQSFIQKMKTSGCAMHIDGTLGEDKTWFAIYAWDGKDNDALYIGGSQYLNTNNNFTLSGSISSYHLDNVTTIRIYAQPYTGTTSTINNVYFQVGTDTSVWYPYSNICPISGLTGLSVYRTGVNVWDEEWENGTFNTTTGVPINTTSTNRQIRSKNTRIPVRGGESYYFKWVNNSASSGLWTMFFDADENIITGFVPSGGYVDKSGNCCLFRNRVVEVPENAAFCKFYCTIDYGDTYNHDLAINYPATVTTYEPYNGNTYSVDWSTQAGTVYGGTVDVVTGQLTVDRVSVNLNPYAKDETANGYYWYTTTNALSIGAISGLNAGLISNRLVALSNITNTTPEGKIAFYANGIIRWKEEGSLPLADYRTYLASNPLQIVYELATPLTYQLTPQEIGVLVGGNNVWTSSGPVSVTVVAPFVGIVTNPTPFEARPMLEVSGVGEITINGKTIQILESVSDFQIDCEAMEAEDNSKIYCMDFPDLSGGENEIAGDGSITALTVTPRWWTL